MNYATPRQVLHAAKMMVDTKVSEESARYLEESGILTDLFKAGLTENGPGSVSGVHIARKTFQRFLGVENPEPDAILRLAHPTKTSELLKDVPHDELLNDENFPYRGRDLVFAELVSFPWPVSPKQAVELAVLWGLTPLRYEDVFVWASIFSSYEKRNKIVFPHEPVYVRGEGPRITCSIHGALGPIVGEYQTFPRSWSFGFAQKRQPGTGFGN